jgi:hypothetical protein
MIDGSTGGSDRSNSGVDESKLEDALEDPMDLVEFFEGVGLVEGLVGMEVRFWGEKFRGWLMMMAAAVRAAWGVKATVWRALAGVRIVLEMAAVVMTVGGNNSLNSCRGGSGSRGGSSGSSGGIRASNGSCGGTRASNGSCGVRSDVAADCRGAGNRGGGTSCAFQTPISPARRGNYGEEIGWSFENIMGMMMAQQSGDREAREMEHKLRCKGMAAQREEGHLAMEREASLQCKEMALHRKENRVQHQMMNVMLMSLI